MAIKIIGISAYYHDSVAALIIDGKIIAAVQEERFSRKKHDPSFPEKAIQFILADADLGLDELFPVVSKHIATGHLIGWFQGKMEFGSRVLGGRSIIGDPRSQKMQFTMNLKIKYRESFRPFAPSVKVENVSEWFDFEGISPYMLMVAKVREDKQLPISQDQEQLFGIDKLSIPRSQIPAITHVRVN